eukprot:s500_g3.t1
MCGLQKAWVLLLSLFLPVLCGRWDWSESVWYRGSWWRKHYETDYWCLVTADGELEYQSDVDWFESWGFDAPWPEQGHRRPRRTGCRLTPAADADDHGFVHSPGATSSAGPPGGLPAQGTGNDLTDALLKLQELLGMKNRWDTHSFRSQLKRTIKRLCEREGIPKPDWWEGSQLSTHQYKMKAHQFTNDLLNRKLNNLGTGPVTGLPAQGTGDTPHHSPDPSTPGGAGPSTAQTIVYMMQNMLDDLNVMHPGVREEVRAAFGSPRLPTAELPSNNNPNGTGDGSPTEASNSSSSSGSLHVERQTKSEPALKKGCLHKAVLKLLQLKWLKELRAHQLKLQQLKLQQLRHFQQLRFLKLHLRLHLQLALVGCLHTAWLAL